MKRRELAVVQQAVQGGRACARALFDPSVSWAKSVPLRLGSVAVITIFYYIVHKCLVAMRSVRPQRVFYGPNPGSLVLRLQGSCTYCKAKLVRTMALDLRSTKTMFLQFNILQTLLNRRKFEPWMVSVGKVPCSEEAWQFRCQNI